jgi:hypothetical protein
MSCFTDLEEPPTKEFDPDYTDDLGDDLTSDTPHPFEDPITHCKYLEFLVLYFYAIILLIGCMVVYCFLSHLPCCNLTLAHLAIRLDVALSLVTYCFALTRIISVM